MSGRGHYWACCACRHRNLDEDGPVCENCDADNGSPAAGEDYLDWLTSIEPEEAS